MKRPVVYLERMRFAGEEIREGHAVQTIRWNIFKNLVLIMDFNEGFDPLLQKQSF